MPWARGRASIHAGRHEHGEIVLERPFCEAPPAGPPQPSRSVSWAAPHLPRAAKPSVMHTQRVVPVAGRRRADTRWKELGPILVQPPTPPSSPPRSEANRSRRSRTRPALSSRPRLARRATSRRRGREGALLFEPAGTSTTKSSPRSPFEAPPAGLRSPFKVRQLAATPPPARLGAAHDAYLARGAGGGAAPSGFEAEGAVLRG